MDLAKRMFGYCPCCQQYFVQPKRRRQNTAYHDDELNWVYCCDTCFQKVQEYWDERWEEYYSSRY